MSFLKGVKRLLPLRRDYKSVDHASRGTGQEPQLYCSHARQASSHQSQRFHLYKSSNLDTSDRDMNM